MDSKDFWNDIISIIDGDFSPKGLYKLECYAEQFISGKLVYQRFSPAEQHGCSAGGPTNVIATLLAGADAAANRGVQKPFDYQEECERGKAQEAIIESWSRKAGCWYDDTDIFFGKCLGENIAEGGEALVYKYGNDLLKTIGLDYYIQPILALDRVCLHNSLFPETSMSVLGFGRKQSGEWQIVVGQPYVQGKQMSDGQISEFAQKIGFKLVNPRNWTFATPNIYLSDLHDENVILSKEGNIFVVDCDVRINTPELRCGGIRVLTTEVKFVE
ncbi:MAG: hypothetical protein IKX43_00885 [Paludibacteraceae bacterium]|nr:hypothetical protein [Paludibacteraceae bacterium]